MKRCVIIAGADIKDYAYLKTVVSQDDFIVYCDCGLKHMDHLALKADLVVGDFDSHAKPEMDVEIIALPCEKDDTDTMYAIKEMLNRGFDDFILMGVIGNRLDHSLANLAILDYLDNRNVKALIIDDYSDIEIVSSVSYIEDKYKYFSLLNLYGNTNNITIENAKYNLYDACITTEYQYGVSNEVIKGQKVKVTLSAGKMLLIKDR